MMISQQGALTYVAIANRDRENDKPVNLMVLTTAEKSKTVRYHYNAINVFEYDIVALSDLDAGEIINNVEPKILNNEKVSGHDLVLYALLPIIDTKNMQDHIRRVVDSLSELKNASFSLRELSFGIEWIIVEKYVDDDELRNIFCDLLGDKMSLIHEYGKRKEQSGIEQGIEKGIEQGIEKGIEQGSENIIIEFLKSGMSCEDISQRCSLTLDEILKIKNKM